MARSDKSATVAELADELRGSTAVVLTEYRGLSVGQLAELRRALGGNASYAVLKNTLTKIAAKEAGIDGIDEHLVGPSAIAFVKGDPVDAAQGLRDFAELHPVLVIKGGVLDGQLLGERDPPARRPGVREYCSPASPAAEGGFVNAASLFALRWPGLPAR